MRYVKSTSRQVMLEAKDGTNYILYTYLLDDGSLVDSLQEFEPDEPVSVWYDEKWNKAKLKKRGE